MPKSVSKQKYQEPGGPFYSNRLFYWITSLLFTGIIIGGITQQWSLLHVIGFAILFAGMLLMNIPLITYFSRLRRRQKKKDIHDIFNLCLAWIWCIGCAAGVLYLFFGPRTPLD